ncbi:ExbD/TolR family protein [Candidatus Magnetaquiglobus chichijimensis]|uniref:ExbD/TolR family protein n=1 Tax=Candidatus Magnetaquiglobus chichijimensis TaxID=3141448 RepID=UPI003B97501E
MAIWLSDAEGEDRPLAEINVTPLVDVMLVLLVIFIILAPVMANSLKVALPKASGEMAAVQTPVIILLEADGTLRLGENATDREALAVYLKDAAARDPELLLRIDADGATAYQKLAELLSLVQEQGIRRIAFTTLRP